MKRDMDKERGRVTDYRAKEGGKAVVRVLVSRSPNWPEIRDYAFIWHCK